MGEPQKTLKVFIGKVLRAGASGYMVPGRHPLEVGAGGALGPAPSAPGVLIPYLRPFEVPVRDERHLALLREDVVLKDAIISDKRYAELVAREGGAPPVANAAEVELRRKVAELQSDLEAAGAHYDALEAAAEAKSKAHADSETEVVRLVSEVAHLKAQVEQDAAAAQAEAAGLRKQVADLEAELAATRKQVDDLTKPPPAPVASSAAAAPPAPPTQAKPEDKSGKSKPR